MSNGFFDGVGHPWRLSVAVAPECLARDREIGLSNREAERRRRCYGCTILEKTHKRSVHRLLFRQFADFLIAAAALAWYLDDFRGAGILIVIVLINAMIGTTSEELALIFCTGVLANNSTAHPPDQEHRTWYPSGIPPGQSLRHWEQGRPCSQYAHIKICQDRRAAVR
tara:strand:+ start:5033 stop:5536 length:504 start_codon:yes stop_codon:yes gene_type:complete